MDFCTLGMFIIDEIEFKPPRPPVKNILGGAGSYSAVGARMLSPPPEARSIGWIVDIGSDFPPELLEVIKSWETACLLRQTPDRLTTRGWNGYGENEHRAFKYTTTKLRLDHTSLTPDLLRSKSFHLICSPARCLDLVRGIAEKRRGVQDGQPLFIWEPVPDLCIPEELQNCYAAVKSVDIVSPNHLEICTFFGTPAVASDGSPAVENIEKCTKSLLESGVGQDFSGSVVVRAGAAGCFVATKHRSRWLPAYHTLDGSKVIDPTGGGNAFLGGLAVGLVRGKPTDGLSKVEEAAAWGSVAASFAIEQIGMPILGHNGETETWNREDVFVRLESFKRRLAC